MGVASRAQQRLADSAYHGHAKDAPGYLRESILEPSAFLAPGERFSTPDGVSFMPASYHTSLSSEQVDDLVAYLETLD